MRMHSKDSDKLVELGDDTSEDAAGRFCYKMRDLLELLGSDQAWAMAAEKRARNEFEVDEDFPDDEEELVYYFTDQLLGTHANPVIAKRQEDTVKVNLVRRC